MHFDWIEAGERTQQTVRLLSEQLRRFLDDQVWLDNRRVFELLRGIEAHALAVRDHGDDRTKPGMDDRHRSIELGLPFERPLYTPQSPPMIESRDVTLGEEGLDTDILYGQIHVDLDELGRTVRAGTPRPRPGRVDRAGRATSPLEQGLAELIGYLSLTDPAYAVVFDEQHRTEIGWDDEADETVRRTADLPTVSFARSGESAP